MRRLSISTAHAFLLVYSVDDEDSFNEVRQLWQQIREQRTGYQELPCVVVGNKSDLSNSTDSSPYHLVPFEEVRQWAESSGLSESSLLEVSARDGSEITTIFYRLLAQASSPSTTLRRLEPLVRRRLSGNSARMNPHRARLREKEAGNGASGASMTDDGCEESGGVKLSRSRSLIRRMSKPKIKRSTESSPKNDCVIS